MFRLKAAWRPKWRPVKNCWILHYFYMWGPGICRALTIDADREFVDFVQDKIRQLFNATDEKLYGFNNMISFMNMTQMTARVLELPSGPEVTESSPSAAESCDEKSSTGSLDSYTGVAEKLPDGNRPAKLRVGIVGDSILCSQYEFYPLMVGAILDSDRVEVSPECLPGITTGGLLGMDEIYDDKFERMSGILEKGYDEIVLAVSVNDLASGRTLTEIGSKLIRICDVIANSGTSRIVLVGSTPFKGFRKWTPEKGDGGIAFNDMLEVLAEELNERYAAQKNDTSVLTVQLYEKMEDPEWPGQLLYPTIYPDKIDWLHPSVEGLEIMAQAIVDQAYLTYASEEYSSRNHLLNAVFRDIDYLAHQEEMLKISRM